MNNLIFVKIPDLPTASDLDGTELIEIVKNGTSFKATADLLKAQGKSAYELAVQGGFTGTIADWLLSLKGETGDKGDAGTNGINGVNGTNGIDGVNGTNGKSAYEIAISRGFSGSEQQWLDSLQGPKGDIGSDGINGVDGLSAYQSAVQKGFVGTEEQWLQSLKGEKGEKGDRGDPGANGTNGLSAYEIAVINGFIGSEEEWLQSLQGTAGLNGASAYESAVAAGFTGSEVEWLSTLNGADGVDGVDGTNGTDGVIVSEFPPENPIDGLRWVSLADGSEYTWIIDPETSIGQWVEAAPEVWGKAAQTVYEMALADGFVGTQTEWLQSLKGRDGVDGINGVDGLNGTNGIDGINGTNGVDGADGLSAYEIAVNNGFVGTEEQWLESLSGGSPAGVVQLSENIVATEDMQEGMFVNIWNNAGTAGARKSDSTVPGRHVHGFILNAVTAGNAVTVYFAGLNDKCSGLVIGDHYLSSEPGRTSPFTPSMTGHVLQTVGLAISPTRMIFNPSDPVTLG